MPTASARSAARPCLAHVHLPSTYLVSNAEWLVHRLLDHRKVKRGARHIDQYLVEWKGYPISEATWEPIENLTGSMQLVAKCNKQRHVQLSAAETLIARTFAQVARSPMRAA